MKRILATIISVMLVATLALSGTIAYLTDDESEINVMSVGKVDIELIEHQRELNQSDYNRPTVDGELKEFTEIKNLVPVTGYDAEGNVVTENNRDKWGLSKEKNYEDKIVRVTNNGESDAWVRIFVAVPSALEAVNGDTTKVALHWDSGEKFVDEDSQTPAASSPLTTPYNFAEFFGTDWKDPIIKNFPIKVGDAANQKEIEFNIYCFTSQRVLKPGETTPAAMVGVYLDKKVDYNDKDSSYYYDDKGDLNNKIYYDLDGDVYIPVFAQAIQSEGFPNAYLAFNGSDSLNYAAGEGKDDDNMPGNPWAGGVAEDDNTNPPTGGGIKVKTKDELNAALRNTNGTHIVVDLEADVDLEISAHVKAYYIGGQNTKSITINGNGHTLTFDHKNSDWNYLRANSDDTKLTFNNVKLTNKGYNNGPWNRHDIRFYNEVTLNDVTSDKAIALLNDANLKNVKISDTHPDNSEAYGLWITADGQTVNIDGLQIFAHSTKTTDRGIKIGDQYVDTPKKVTLNINNAWFKTQKKAAILVTSPAGADIKLSLIDIKEVKADTVNAVWVDEDRAGYADQVTVTGGTKIVEGQSVQP